jgi:hypothetical protein
VKLLPLVLTAMFVFVCPATHADSFQVSKVSWVNNALQVEVQTDSPDGADFYVGIADEQTGNNLISKSIFVRVEGGRFVAEGFTEARNVTPLKAGHYWLAIAEYDFSSIVRVLPITIPANKRSVAAKKKKAADDEHSDLLSEPVVNDQIQRIQGLNSAAQIVLVARDKKTVEERDEAGSVNDERAMQQLVEDGKLVVVKSGTKVKVISLYYSNPILAEIRILEGSQKGRHGYVRFCEIVGTCTD